MIVSAIAGSITDDDSDTTPVAASPSVIECATVKVVTMPRIGRMACDSRSTGCQPRGVRRITEGSSRQISNSTWS